MSTCDSHKAFHCSIWSKVTVTWHKTRVSFLRTTTTAKSRFWASPDSDHLWTSKGRKIQFLLSETFWPFKHKTTKLRGMFYWNLEIICFGDVSLVKARALVINVISNKAQNKSFSSPLSLTVHSKVGITKNIVCVCF